MTGGPVDTFLAELGRHLRRDATTQRRVVAEVGDHLRDLVAEGRARGLDEHAAELEAVDRFGSARVFARGIRSAPRSARSLRAGAVVAAVAVAAGGLAVAESRRGNERTPTAEATPRVQAPADDPAGCFAAVMADRRIQALAVRMLHPDAVDTQVLVQIGTRVAIDPRTGKVLCRAAGANGRNKTIWFVTSNTKAPFG